MAESVDLDKKSIIFPRIERDKAQVAGFSGPEKVSLPDGYGVILSVGCGHHRADTPYTIRLGFSWNEVYEFSLEAADVLAFTHYDQALVRFVVGENLKRKHPINPHTVRNIEYEIGDNYVSR